MNRWTSKWQGWVGLSDNPAGRLSWPEFQDGPVRHIQAIVWFATPVSTVGSKAAAIWYFRGNQRWHVYSFCHSIGYSLKKQGHLVLERVSAGGLWQLLHCLRVGTPLQFLPVGFVQSAGKQVCASKHWHMRARKWNKLWWAEYAQHQVESFWFCWVYGGSPVFRIQKHEAQLLHGTIFLWDDTAVALLE